jgi:hypothetical protein
LLSNEIVQEKFISGLVDRPFYGAVRLGARTTDESLWIVSAHSDTEPGEIYVWNPKAQTLEPQYRVREELPRAALSPGRPIIKPSGMEKATEPKSDRPSAERPKRGPTRTKLTIHEEKIIKVAVPPGRAV